MNGEFTKISDLIKHLKTILEKDGDLVVVSQEGDRNIYPTSFGSFIIEGAKYNENGYFIKEQGCEKILYLGWSA